MKQVSILPLYNSTLNSIDTCHQIFTRVNDFMHYQGKPAFYNVEIVGETDRVKLSRLYEIFPDRKIEDADKTDVIILPLLCGDFSATIAKNKIYNEWLVTQHQKGAEIICVCVGSFFLASTGLLNGRQCAVHWAAKNEFRMMFPQVKIIDDSIITDEQGIYTCGGGFSYLNLLLYVIEKHIGREMAILASKMFEIDMDRKNQYPFTIFIGQKQHGDELVLQAQQHIEKNPTQTFTVDELCEQLGVGRRTFERRFKKHTGNSMIEYSQRVKVEFAKKLLESRHKTINEIVYETGYNDVDSFRKIFKKFTDLSPLDYRKKFAM